MLSNARGKHSSPGVYMEEINKTYASKSLGITILGVVGETLKGPAFELIRISDWMEFQEYFGETSTEKFKGTGYPKYELPYIAKSYLQESKQLEVCRILGLSGFDYGKAWAIYGTKEGSEDKYLIAILRSKASYKTSNIPNVCEPTDEQDKIQFLVTDVTMSPYTTIESVFAGCDNTNTSKEGELKVGLNKYGTFKLTIKTEQSEETVALSLSPGDKNYIVNVLGTSAQEGDYSLFVEEFYDLAHIKVCDSENRVYDTINIEGIDGLNNYKEMYRCAFTPWFVSELKGNGSNVEIKKLFRFYTISDGNAANSQIKITIANILPDEGLFDVIIRDYYDNDTTPTILERFNKCNMVPGSSNYIGLKIGTYNGEYENKSKYVVVEVIENDMTETCVPCGFLGYPMRGVFSYIETEKPAGDETFVKLENVPTDKYIDSENKFHEIIEVGEKCYKWSKMEEYKNLELDYNTNVYDYIKPNKQYFGMSDITGVDLDVLNYKGKGAYTTKQLPSEGYSNGFHLDSFINAMTDSYVVTTEIIPDDIISSVSTFNEIPTTKQESIKDSDGKEYNIIKVGNEYYEWTEKSAKMVKCTVDGIEGYTFTTPDETVGHDLGAETMPHITSEDLMEKNIYSDKRYRKFTCYPYGGFDGWDIYRKKRTNTKDYKANKYKGIVGDKYTFTNTFDGSAFGLTGKIINSDYYAYLAGYKQFDNPSKIKINLLATPGIDYVNNLDLVNEVLDIVEESRQGDCLYIVTTPDRDENGFEIDAEAAVANLEVQEINTSYATTYYPWVKYYDAANKKYINLPVTKDVVRNFAYTDNVSHPWFASAGMSRGSVDCVKATHFTKLDEEDTLYEGLINPVKSFGADGVKIWGNKTLLNEETPVNRINVRRLMIRVKDLVSTASQQLIFEQNDNTVESQFRSIIDPILANAKQNRGISDYKIKTDTSAEARDRKELPAAIYVKPIGCLEYIPISFTIYPESVAFDD